MIKNITLAVLSAGLLVTSACAQEVETPAAAVNEVVQATALNTQTEFANLYPDADWRDVDLENSLYITTKYGVFVVELATEFAPLHTEQIKTLARQKFYDGITFHRVIDGFMNQTGDPKGDGTGDSSLPDIPAEFTFRRAPGMHVELVGRELSTAGEVETGFYKSYPVATKPISQAILTKDGKVDAWGLHCPGTTSMARGGNDINSANSQFFLMRSEYTSLNRLYSIWGMTVWGRDGLTKIKVGTKGDDQGFIPDRMETVRIAADVAEDQRIPVQVLRTDSESFKAHLNSLKNEAGQLPKACDIEVPTRLKP